MVCLFGAEMVPISVEHEHCGKAALLWTVVFQANFILCLVNWCGKMSLKGVRQMKELVIRYSDYDGSSKGIREWMRTNLVQFAQNNPDLAVKTELKRCVHPFVRGNYMNGNSKTICIKNLQPENITGYVNDLRNQIGRKVSLRLSSLSHTYSTQTSQEYWQCSVRFDSFRLFSPFHAVRNERLQEARADEVHECPGRVARENGPDWSRAQGCPKVKSLLLYPFEM